MIAAECSCLAPLDKGNNSPRYGDDDFYVIDNVISFYHDLSILSGLIVCFCGIIEDPEGHKKEALV